MNRALRVVLATAITLGLLVAAGPQALACSCAGGDPRTSLRAADAAIVGTLDRIGQARDDGKSPFHFKIERAVKGPFGSTLDVVGQAGDGASCGIEIRVGQRAGLFLERSGNEWTAFLCSQVDADMLLAAARPMPKPDGVAPAALVAAVEWGDVRMLALDSSGRTIAYGSGGPVLSLVAVCPGGKLAVGWGWRDTLVVRDVATMRLVAQAAIADGFPEEGNSMLEIGCRDEAARDVVLFATTGFPDAQGEIMIVRDLKVARRITGAWKTASFQGASAFMSGGSFGHTLESVDLKSGRARHIARIAKFGEPEEVGRAVPSPDGRYLATAAIVPSGGHGPTPSRAILVDLGTSPPEVFSGSLPGEQQGGDVAWISRDRFVLPSTGGTSTVFDTTLRRLGTFTGWSAGRPGIAGSVAYGMAYGALHAARLPGGPIHEVRKFDTTQTHAVAVVPGIAPPADLGPVVTPPPEEEPGPVAAPPRAPRPRSPLLPIVVFVTMFVVTPIAALLVRRSRSS